MVVIFKVSLLVTNNFHTQYLNWSIQWPYEISKPKVIFIRQISKQKPSCFSRADTHRAHLWVFSLPNRHCSLSSNSFLGSFIGFAVGFASLFGLAWQVYMITLLRWDNTLVFNWYNQYELSSSWEKRRERTKDKRESEREQETVNEAGGGKPVAGLRGWGKEMQTQLGRLGVGGSQSQIPITRSTTHTWNLLPTAPERFQMLWFWMSFYEEYVTCVLKCLTDKYIRILSFSI